MLIALFIICKVIKNLRKSFSIILQANPKEIDIDGIHEKLLAPPEITGVYDCHVWMVSITCFPHLRLDRDYSLKEMIEIKSKVKALLKPEIQHVTIGFEGVDEVCEGC